MMKNKRYDLYRRIPGSTPDLVATNVTEKQCARRVEQDADFMARVLRLSSSTIESCQWYAELHRDAA